MTDICRGLKEELSPLECDVLKIILPHKKMRVRDIYQKLAKKGIALTSIAVILDRLHKRGLVDRNMETCRGGTRYLYFPKKDIKKMEEQFVKNAVEEVIRKFGDSAITYFGEKYMKR